MYKLTVALLLTLVVTFKVSAQEFVWQGKFDFRFNNNEYGDGDSNMGVPSGTRFAVRLTPEIGLDWDDRNRLMIGSELTKPFGDKRFMDDPQLLLYYRYSAPRLSSYVGLFSRDVLIGNYTRAIFSSSYEFYHNIISGGVVQYSGKRGYNEAGIDWDGMQTSTQREKFRLFSSAQYKRDWFYGGYDFSVYHFAGTSSTAGGVDYTILIPYAGIDFTHWLPLQKLSLQASWLQTSQRDRITGDKSVRPSGAQIDVRVQKWNFGFVNSLYIGGNIMPFYDKYGSELYSGEPFYGVMKDVYNRTELYYVKTWQKRTTMRLYARFVVQYNGSKVGTQQLLHFSININKKQFLQK